jgi:hypothetical protein
MNLEGRLSFWVVHLVDMWSQIGLDWNRLDQQ